MIPEDEPSEKMYRGEDIKMQLDKIEVIEKKLDGLTNRFEALIRSNKAQHDKIWARLDHDGELDV